MIEVYAFAAVILLFAGAVVGFLAVISVGIRREEAALTVTTPTRDRLASGVRVINGMTSRTPGIVREVRLDRQGLLPVQTGREAAA